MNAENKPKRLGEILIDEGVITNDQLEIALTEQKKIHEPLGKLLKARRQLADLMRFMDGKADAQALVGQVLKYPALLKGLATAPRSNGNGKEGVKNG